MTKIRKVLLFIICIILFTGCTATEKVSLTDDGKIKENVSVMEKNADVLYGSSTLEESIEQYLSEYEDALRVRKYSYDIKIKDEESGAVLTNTYDDMCSFIRKTSFSQYLYKKFNCAFKDGYYVVESSGEFLRKDSFEEPWKVPDKIILKIDLGVNLEENNADSVNKTTYTWNFDTDTPSSKEIKFKVNKSKLDGEKERRIKEKQEAKTKKKIINAFILIFVIIILAVVSYFVYKVLKKKYEYNKIDY